MTKNYSESELSVRFGSLSRNSKIPSLSAVTNAFNDITKSFSISCQVVSNLNDIEDLSNLNGGTIAIVSSLIDGIHENRKSYIWRKDNTISGLSGQWEAFDNDFDASKVYFENDIKMVGTYDRVGNIKITDGTLSCKGKSIYTVFNNIFNTVVKPEMGDNPKASISLNKSGYYEVGNILTDISYSTTYTQGKYNQPWSSSVSSIEDGTSVSAWNVSFNGKTYSTASQTNITLSVTDGCNKYASLTSYYTDGNKAEDSEGVKTDLYRKASSISTKSNSIIGYRNMFVGSLTANDISELSSSDYFRTYATKITAGAKTIIVGNRSGVKYDVNIGENKKIIYVAIPNTYKINNVEDEPTGGTIITGAYNKERVGTVSIYGYGNIYPMNYDVYCCGEDTIFNNIYHKIEITLK